MRPTEAQPSLQGPPIALCPASGLANAGKDLRGLVVGSPLYLHNLLLPGTSLAQLLPLMHNVRAPMTHPPNEESRVLLLKKK